MSDRQSKRWAYIMVAIFVLLILWMTCGGSMAWADCVNDSADCGAVVTITGLPDTISSDDTYYRLAGNLSSADGGIYMDNVDNAQLDLNGFSITYSTDGGNNEHGIHAGWSCSAYRIKNGSVLYGADSTEAHSATGNTAVNLWTADSVIIESLYVTFGGENARGIAFPTTGGAGGKDVTIRQTTCSSMVHSQTSRTAYYTAGIKFDRYEYATGDVHDLRVDTCRLLNMLHCGIFAGGNHDEAPKVILNCDSIWVDVNNRNYTNVEGDPFGITFYYYADGSQIKDCYVYGIPTNPTSKTSGNGGNGIFLQGGQGTSGTGIEVSGNHVEAGFQCQSGGGATQYAIALYMRWAESATLQWSAYHDIHDNQFWGWGDSTNWPNRIETVRFAVDSGFQHNCFYNNQCYAIQKDSTGGEMGDANYAIGIGAMDSTRDERTAQGTEVYDVRGNIWYNNKYYTNTGNPLELGGQANHELGGGGIIMFGDTVYRGTDASDSAAVVFNEMTYRHSSTGSRIIDLTCQGYTKDTVVFGTITQNDDCEGKDLTYQRQVEVVVEDSLGNPVGGADVWIWDNYNDTTTIKVTDGAGKIYDTLTYAKYHYISPEAGDSCNWADSLSYNDRHIKASHDGLSDSITATINISWDGSDTVSLATAVSSGGLVGVRK